MRKARARRPSPALIVALVALFVALGGTVYAAGRIDGGTIMRGSIPGNRLAAESVPGDRLKKGTVTGDRLKDGTLTGQQVADHSLGAQQIDGSKLSPRAYGFVTDGGVISDSKNVIGNATGPTGIYCITLDPSIDASRANVVITVDGAPDNNDGTLIVPLAYYSSIAELGCSGSNDIAIQTYALEDKADGGDSVVLQNEFFSFVVP